MQDIDGAEIIASLGDGLTLVRMESYVAATVAPLIGWGDFPGRSCACVRDASRRIVAMYAYNNGRANEAGFPSLRYGFVVPEFERLRPLVERLERAGHLHSETMFKDGMRCHSNGRTSHHKDWLPHRLDGPAVEWAGGKGWFKDGIRHRDGDLPAEIKEYPGSTPHNSYWVEGRRHRDGDKPAVESLGVNEWWLNGVRHRSGGEPAVMGVGVTREWWVEGKRHRDGDLPALVDEDGSRWYRNGKLHRDGGQPAVVYADGSVEHWVDGVQTGNRFLSDWKIVSQALVSSLELGVNGEFQNHRVANSNRAGISHRINAVVKLLEKQDGVNSISGLSAGMLEAVRKACQSDTRGYLQESDRISSEIKCLKLGAIVASGRFADLTVAERDSLLELLELMPKGRKWISLVSPGGPGNPPAGAPLDRDGLARLVAEAPLKDRPSTAVGPVAFALEWRPAVPVGRITRPYVIATGHAALEHVGQYDAPVVAALPTDDGYFLDVRIIDGEFFRPVLAPGSFRPLAESEFRTAVGEGAAWRDNPYRERPNPAFCAMAVDEVATSKKSGLADKDAERDVVAAAIARAGRLVVVDGQVYRRTTEPTVEIVKTTARILHPDERVYPDEPEIEEDAGWRIAWRFQGDIAQTDSQSIVVTSRHKVAYWMTMPCTRHRVDDEKRRRFGLTLPLPLQVEAERLLSRTAARAFGDRVNQASFNIPTANNVSLPSQRIVIHDPSAFTATPEIHAAQIKTACAALEAKVSVKSPGEDGVGRPKAADLSLAAEVVDLDNPVEVNKLCEDAVELVRATEALYANGDKFGMLGPTPYEMALLETAAEALSQVDDEFDEGLAFGL